MMRLKQGWKNLWEDQRGIGTVEMILILVVLIALVLGVYKRQPEGCSH